MVLVASLALAALVNADALVERAERKPLGAGRDRSLAIWHPVQDIAHITQLHRLRGSRRLASAATRIAAATRAAPSPDDAPGRRPAPSSVPRCGPGRRAPLRVYIGGDSVVRDAGESFLQHRQRRQPLLGATLHYEIATGLSRPDFFDWPARAGRRHGQPQPEVVLLMFGGNDAQGIVAPDGTATRGTVDAGWRAEYARRVGRVMDQLRAATASSSGWASPRCETPGSTAGAGHGQQSTGGGRHPAVGDLRRHRHRARRRPRAARRAAPIGGNDVDLRQGDGIHLSRAGADVLARHLLDLDRREIAVSPHETGAQLAAELHRDVVGRALGHAERGGHGGGGVAGAVAGVEAGLHGRRRPRRRWPPPAPAAPVEHEHQLAPGLVLGDPRERPRRACRATSPRGAW